MAGLLRSSTVFQLGLLPLRPVEIFHVLLVPLVAILFFPILFNKSSIDGLCRLGGVVGLEVILGDPLWRNSEGGRAFNQG